jgi:hypothetical protein
MPMESFDSIKLSDSFHQQDTQNRVPRVENAYVGGQPKQEIPDVKAF